MERCSTCAFPVIITENVYYEKGLLSQIFDVLRSKWPKPRDFLVLKEGLQGFFPAVQHPKLADYHHYLWQSPVILDANISSMVEKMSDGLLGKQTADTDLKSLSVCQPANGIVCFNSNLSAKISPLRELWAESGRSNWTYSLWRRSRVERKHFVHGNSTSNNRDEQWNHHFAADRNRML